MRAVHRFVFALLLLLPLAAHAQASVLSREDLQESLAQKPSLDLLAVNRPDELEGVALLDADGAELGRIENVARRTDDGSLHVLVRMRNDQLAALRLDTLTLAALTFWDPSRQATDAAYAADAFEPLHRQEAGRSMPGNSPRPTADSTTVEDLPAPAAPAYDTFPENTAPIARMALLEADALAGKLLVDAVGAPLGSIETVVRGREDGTLHGVVVPALGERRTAVPLDALTIAIVAVADESAAMFDEAVTESRYETLERP